MTISAKYGPWALVTGATRGIGKAFAEALAADGINIVLLARNGPLLRSVADALEKQYGVQTRIVVADLADSDTLIDRIEQETQDLDIGLLIANAAIAHFSQLHRATSADILGLIRINVMSMALLCQYFGRRLVTRGGGGIVPVSSNGAYCMLPNEANYSASKAYVAHLGEILHYELRARNVDVMTLFPPLVDTDMITDHETRNEWDFSRLQFGMGQKAKPELIAKAALQALNRRQLRVHPPRASGVFMWIIRRLPDRVRCAIFNQTFAKAVYPEHQWW